MCLCRGWRHRLRLRQSGITAHLYSCTPNKQAAWGKRCRQVGTAQRSTPHPVFPPPQYCISKPERLQHKCAGARDMQHSITAKRTGEAVQKGSTQREGNARWAAAGGRGGAQRVATPASQ